MTKIDTSPAAIAAIMDGVTPGPWKVPGQPDKICADGYTKNGAAKTVATVTIPGWMTGGEPFANADFIAAARELVPALAAERDALRAENERLRAELSVAADVFSGIANHILGAKGTDIPPNTKGIFADCQRAGLKIRAALKGGSNG